MSYTTWVKNDEKPEFVPKIWQLSSYSRLLMNLVGWWEQKLPSKRLKEEWERRRLDQSIGQGLLRHRWRHRITSQPLKSLLQRNNFVPESRLNSSISSTSVLIQPFPSQHLRTASDRTKSGWIKGLFLTPGPATCKNSWPLNKQALNHVDPLTLGSFQ